MEIKWRHVMLETFYFKIYFINVLVFCLYYDTTVESKREVNLERWGGGGGGAGKVLEPHGVSRQRLTEGVSETWCWHDRHSDNSQSHYFSGVAWMGLASICANCKRQSDWLMPVLELEKFSTSAKSNASEATRGTHNSVQQHLTWIHSK